MKEYEKITYYIKENLLVGSLYPGFFLKSPDFTNYVNGHSLSYKTYEHYDITPIEENVYLVFYGSTG